MWSTTVNGNATAEVVRAFFRPMHTGVRLIQNPGNKRQRDIACGRECCRRWVTSTRQARLAGKPMVFSSIHHSLREISRYEKHGRGGLTGFVTGLLGYRNLEMARSNLRVLRYRQLLGPTLNLIRSGLHSAQLALLRGVDLILVLTDKEKADILDDFGPLPTSALSVYATASNQHLRDQSITTSNTTLV